MSIMEFTAKLSFTERVALRRRLLGALKPLCAFFDLDHRDLPGLSQQEDWLEPVTADEIDERKRSCFINGETGEAAIVIDPKYALVERQLSIPRIYLAVAWRTACGWGWCRGRSVRDAVFTIR